MCRQWPFMSGNAHRWQAAFRGRQGNRMPAVIEKADWPAWLGKVQSDPAALLRPPAGGVLRA